MKKLIYLFFGLALSFSTISANAQSASFVTFNTTSDTTSAGLVAGDQDAHVSNGIKSNSSNPVYIRWTLSNIVLPTGVSLSFCDNANCYYNLSNGQSFISSTGAVGSLAPPYTNSGFGTFYATFAGMAGAPNNSHAWVKVTAVDTVTHFTRALVFHAYKGSLGIVTTTVSEDNMVLYPNPAREAVNVVYSPNAGVKNIAIYNLIGKVVKVFRPMDDNSAKLDIDNIPTGMYFVRLMDAQGHVVATRRFTRQ